MHYIWLETSLQYDHYTSLFIAAANYGECQGLYNLGYFGRPERLQLRNNQDILCMEGVGGKVKRDAKFFGVACAENGV